MPVSEKRACQNCKNSFQIDPEDFVFYEKMKVPPPMFCPQCRLQRRLAFRNERALYKRNCDLCKESFISTYAPDAPYTVYCNPCWWSDKWNPKDYGRPYDPKRYFHEQFLELSRRVPHMGVFAPYTTLKNSDYTNLVSNLKNCYLIFNSDYDENCAYGTEIEHSKECFDNLMIDGCELCYETVNCQKCYRTFFSVDCESSQDVWFSRNLVGCSNCFGCVNLRNKKYYIWNEPVGEAEYKKMMAEMKLSIGEIAESKLKLSELSLRLPAKFAHERQNKNVSGDYIYNSKESQDAYIATGAEHTRYSMWLLIQPVKDAWDFTEFGNNVEMAYDSITLGENISNCRFSRQSYNNCRNLEYDLYCVSSADLFGCVSMRNAKYCILNKEYLPEEFAQLRGEIVSQMESMPYRDKQERTYPYGEFFPIEHSQFAYNETSAQEHFPLTKEQALAAGYAWRDMIEKSYRSTKQAEDLEMDIRSVPDSILNEVIGCAHKGQCGENCTAAFKLIPQELDFYRKASLPLPILCPNCRHAERLRLRNPVRLWSRSCGCAGKGSGGGAYTNQSPHFHAAGACPNVFKTAYAPERKEIVYCAECYKAEVI